MLLRFLSILHISLIRIRCIIVISKWSYYLYVLWFVRYTSYQFRSVGMHEATHSLSLRYGARFELELGLDY